MIISEEHQFAFIHIPKCAGTSVRKPLTPFNNWNLAGPPWQKSHSELGCLDYGHIPLFVLRNHFPSEFKAVMSYWSFAVVRDPFDRFGSSLSQRLKKYSDQPIQNRSIKDVQSFIIETIDYLSGCKQEGYLLPLEYIHFQRQTDYVQLDGERIIESLYTVNQIDRLLADVSRKTSNNPLEAASSSKSIPTNRTVVYRNDLLRGIIDTSRPTLNRLRNFLPEIVKQKVRDQIYVSRDQRLKDLFEAEHVRAFIQNHYADDITLYQHVIESERNKKV